MNFGTEVLIISSLWLASEIFLARFRRAKSTDTRMDQSSMRTLWVTIAISVNVGVFSGLQRLGHFPAGSSGFQIAGLVFIVCGIIVRWMAILTLKSHFTVDVAITRNHHLITHGLYRYVRHPSYSGSLLSFLGLGLAFANYISVIAIVAPICWAFLHRIRIEERVLVDNFGAEYETYRASTKRLIPFVY